MPTILIADDDADDADLAVELVRQRGLGAWVVTRGDDALAALRSGNFAAAILDNRMPGLDGVDVLKQLCADYGGPPLPPPPIAIYTGDSQAARRAVDRGAAWYVHKDDPRGLADFLDAALGTA